MIDILEQAAPNIVAGLILCGAYILITCLLLSIPKKQWKDSFGYNWKPFTFGLAAFLLLLGHIFNVCNALFANTEGTPELITTILDNFR